MCAERIWQTCMFFVFLLFSPTFGAWELKGWRSKVISFSKFFELIQMRQFELWINCILLVWSFLLLTPPISKPCSVAILLLGSRLFCVRLFNFLNTLKILTYMYVRMYYTHAGSFSTWYLVFWNQYRLKWRCCKRVPCPGQRCFARSEWKVVDVQNIMV